MDYSQYKHLDSLPIFTLIKPKLKKHATPDEIRKYANEVEEYNKSYQQYRELVKQGIY